MKPGLFTPIIAPLLRERLMPLALSAAALLHLLLASLGFGVWACPLWQATGVPCPGCGMTRAALGLLRGDWRSSLDTHLFAPVLLFALALMLAAASLPESARRSLHSKVETVERRTGLTTLLAAGLIFYWVFRLLFLRESFITLVRG